MRLQLGVAVPYSKKAQIRTAPTAQFPSLAHVTCIYTLLILGGRRNAAFNHGSTSLLQNAVHNSNLIETVDIVGLIIVLFLFHSAQFIF